MDIDFCIYKPTGKSGKRYFSSIDSSSYLSCRLLMRILVVTLIIEIRIGEAAFHHFLADPFVSKIGYGRRRTSRFDDEFFLIVHHDREHVFIQDFENPLPHL